MKFSSLLPIALLVSTSGCVQDMYQDPPPGAHPPPYGHHLDRYQLIDNCQQKVENKLYRQLKRRYPINFARPGVYWDSASRASIEGQASLEMKNRRHEFLWQCKIDRNNGRVQNLHLKWYGKPPQAAVDEHRNRNLKQACKKEIRQRINQEVESLRSLDFDIRRLERIGKKRFQVSGRAQLASTRGKGRISFDCRLRLNPVRVETASYRWLQKPPEQPNLTSRAKRLCHDATRKRLKKQGYANIHILASQVSAAKANRKRVTIKLRADRQGKTSIKRFECVANPVRQRVVRLTEVF